MRRLGIVVVLVLGLTACWPQAGFDAGNPRFSPLPVGVDVTNVASLRHAFTYPVPGAEALVVSGGVAFVAADKLYAFDAAGTNGCTGSAPATCTPLWTATIGPFSSLVVGGGKVWAASGDDFNGLNAVVAFDAAGKAGCTGAPKVCTPLVTIDVEHPDSLRWANDTLYFTSIGDAPSFTVTQRAYRADGTPLWSAVLGPGFPTGIYPFVIDGNVLIVPSGGYVVAFDARGITGCSGSPAVCSPLWTYDAADNQNAARAGRLYSSHGNQLAVYDASGKEGCFGSPKVCYPLWTSKGPFGSLVVTDDNAFVGYGGTISEYPLDTQACTGAIKSCPSSRTFQSIFGAFNLAADAVAGGVLYATRKECTDVSCPSGTVTWQLDAYDESGVRNCTGICRAIWSVDTPTPIDDVEVVGNVVYARPHVGNGQPDQPIWGFTPSG